MFILLLRVSHIQRVSQELSHVHTLFVSAAAENPIARYIRHTPSKHN